MFNKKKLITYTIVFVTLSITVLDVINGVFLHYLVIHIFIKSALSQKWYTSYN